MDFSRPHPRQSKKTGARFFNATNRKKKKGNIMTTNFKDKIQTGVPQQNHLVLIYGISGIGKTTFAASAPKPIFIAPENGTGLLDVARFPEPKSFEDTQNMLNYLTVEHHDYQTLVVDSVDWLEYVFHREICSRYKVKSIELAAGGYGKGYVEAFNMFLDLKEMLSALRKKMNIILIAHSEITNFSDPQQQAEYHRYHIKLHKKTAALMKEFVDSVLFANFKILTKEEGLRTRAYGDGERVLYTESRPGFEAKNRFSLPFELPLSWEEYAAAVKQPTNLPQLVESILALANQIQDQDLKNKVYASLDINKNNSKMLLSIKNRLQQLVNS